MANAPLVASAQNRPQLDASAQWGNVICPRDVLQELVLGNLREIFVLVR